MSMISKTFNAGLILSIALALSGCGEKPATDSKPAPAVAEKHHHEPPHGGTVVEFGEEEFHLELVLDAASGKLQGYFLDAHMQSFVRLPLESFEVTAKVGGKEETLVFKAVANSATGEKVGDTAQFDAQAEWLKGIKSFDGVLKPIAIRGKNYQAIAFNFPKGNE